MAKYDAVEARKGGSLKAKPEWQEGKAGELLRAPKSNKEEQVGFIHSSSSEPQGRVLL